LHNEIDRHNNYQVRSTTGEIHNIRFENAGKAGSSLFRPYVLPKPHTSPKDAFCLRDTRMLNGYRRISLFNQEIEVPHVPLREDVELHMIPDLGKQVLEVRSGTLSSSIPSNCHWLIYEFTFQVLLTGIV